MGGIRSGLTYAGATDVKELQRKAQFIRVSPATAQKLGVRQGDRVEDEGSLPAEADGPGRIQVEEQIEGDVLEADAVRRGPGGIGHADGLRILRHGRNANAVVPHVRGRSSAGA